jgi:sporulation protein YlmC with PRC-barrel domain
MPAGRRAGTAGDGGTRAWRLPFKPAATQQRVGHMDRRNPQTAGRMESFRDFGASRPPEALRPERRRAVRLSSPGRELVGAAALSGERVVTRRGEAIGSVSELMLDLQRGRIAYAVVAHGGFMGIGERLHAIPWRALRIDGECLVLDAERSTFLDAPGFDKEHWPSTPDAAWHHALHRHYRCRPYWEPD